MSIEIPSNHKPDEFLSNAIHLESVFAELGMPLDDLPTPAVMGHIVLAESNNEKDRQVPQNRISQAARQLGKLTFPSSFRL
jgi:hypothetical protein